MTKTQTATALPIDSLTGEEILLLADKMTSALHKLNLAEDWETYLLVMEAEGYIRHAAELRFH